MWTPSAASISTLRHDLPKQTQAKSHVLQKLGASIDSGFQRFCDATLVKHLLSYEAPTSEGAHHLFLPNKRASRAHRLSQDSLGMAAMDLDGAESKSLFAQVQFYIVQTEDLRGDGAREVRVPTPGSKVED